MGYTTLATARDAFDPVARATHFDGTDARLAAVYRHMNSAAIREAFAYNGWDGWDGFENPRLVSFAETAAG